MPGESGGDPHVTTISGHKFKFVGVPGEVYNVINCHGLKVDATVSDVAENVQVWDRSIVHGYCVDVIVHKGRTEVLLWNKDAIPPSPSPMHKVVIKHDSGHVEPGEGDESPDPLIGVPHLDFGIDPNVGLEGATGLMIDGHEHPETEFRLGITWTLGEQ